MTKNIIFIFSVIMLSSCGTTDNTASGLQYGQNCSSSYLQNNPDKPKFCADGLICKATVSSNNVPICQ